MTARSIRRVDALSPEDIVKGSTTLQLAFSTDPLNEYTFIGREDIGRAWFAGRIRYALAAAELYAVGDWDGIAIWEPAVQDETARDAARAAFRAEIVASLGEEVGNAALGRFDRLIKPYLEHENAVAQELGLSLNRDIDVLMILGVHPSSQRQGIGASLVRSFLNDRRVMLLTFTAYDVAFYSRLGFRSVRNWDVGALNCTLMLWTPASLATPSGSPVC